MTVCNLVFGISLFSKTQAIKGYQAISEEALLVTWSIWQTLRMILIAKKQRLAQQSAKTLINFENIVLDTDFGAGNMSARSQPGLVHLSQEENDDYVFDLQNKVQNA